MLGERGGAQMSRPKAEGLIPVCDLLTEASGLFIKPPTKVTMGHMARFVPGPGVKPAGAWDRAPSQEGLTT